MSLTLSWGLLKERRLSRRCSGWRASRIIDLPQCVAMLASRRRHIVLPLLRRSRVLGVGVGCLGWVALLLCVVSLILRGLLRG